ncbi:hypothetical protein EBB_23155 [Methylomonas sp. EbB]|uniref:Uncharacterized protein n=1 Tax=Methylomonas fluvii TaxID=1854564 RepID=A0ABR9DJQ2_9GAMM|nr:hypothetical protein [Methylomonas fluvii]MBD9363327.1 hypothetical protein [Methylomonas fluvii]
MDILTYPVGSYSERADLVNRVVDLVGAEYRPTHVLLDGEDYSKTDGVLEEFKDIAFYWNRDHAINSVPSHVLAVMKDVACHHMVWLSRRALEEDEILFVWIVAHELRHFFQVTHHFSLASLRQESQNLRRRQQYRGLPSGPMAPAELDSDIFAMSTCETFFGKADINCYFARRRLPRCPFTSYPAYLQDLQQLWNPSTQ